MIRFLIALALTCGVTCVVEAVAVSVFKERRQLVKTSFLCNIVTNPVLNVGVALVLVWTNSYNVYYVTLALSELAVVFAEACYYRYFANIGYKRALAISLVANVCSFLSGLVIRALWP